MQHNARFIPEIDALVVHRAANYGHLVVAVDSVVLHLSRFEAQNSPPRHGEIELFSAESRASSSA